MPNMSNRLPNKAGWALDEAITDHDPAVAELLEELVNQVETEKAAAEHRFDKTARLRIAEMLLTLARLQQHSARLATVHQLARHNDYDRYERKQV